MKYDKSHIAMDLGSVLMNFHRRQFLHLAAGTASLPLFSQVTRAKQSGNTRMSNRTVPSLSASPFTSTASATMILMLPPSNRSNRILSTHYSTSQPE